MMQGKIFLMIMTVDMFPTPPKSDQGSDREQAPKSVKFRFSRCSSLL